MTEPHLSPKRIELWKADDARDVVHQVVAALAQGEVVAFSSSGEEGIAASALHSNAVDQLGHGPTTLLLKRAEELADWVPNLGDLGRRLSKRVWPGAVTLVFDVPDRVGLLDRLPRSVRTRLADSHVISTRVPDEDFACGVLDLLAGPVVFRTRGADEPSHDGVRLVIDPGPRSSRTPTVVKISRDQNWSILTAGAVDSATLMRLAGTIILFICTGNTCRSPMAEALCKVRLARRLGCATGELEGRGYVVLSAGIAASNGMSAASNAISVVKSRGGSLTNHQSRKLTADLVLLADHILGMTGDHIEAVLDYIPEVAPRLRVLHPLGHDLADPVGADRETYQRTADTIESSIDHLLDSLGI